MDKHPIGPDGVREDVVRTYAADKRDMGLFAQATAALAEFRAPRLTSATAPQRKMFVAAFDGTWNDAVNDRDHITNVGVIRDQVNDAILAGRSDLAVGYVKGVGTQDNAVVRTLDGALGYTYDARLEEMYMQLMRQAAQWKAENPNVEISVASIGFSRGAEQAAGFTQLLHDRGIQDWTGMRTVIDAEGKRTIQFDKPALVPPGETAQALGMFDPVGTGSPRQYDRRPAPSVISGFQLTSEDERRGLFKSTSIIDMGRTDDGRLLAVWVPGAHSDVGGGYHRNGLSVRSGNLMMDYLNALSDRPFLSKQPEPSDPAMNVVHRSEEGMLLYRVWRKVDRREDSGVVDELAPRRVDGRRVEGDRFNAEPRDETLARRFDFRDVQIAPVPQPAAPSPDARRESPPVRDATQPGDPGYSRLLRSAEAVSALDRQLGLDKAPGRDLLARDRMTAYVASLAERNDLRPDRVVLGEGNTAFVIEDSPAGRRLARFDTREALATPVGASLDRINETTLARAERPPLPDQARTLLAEEQTQPPRAALTA